MNSYRWEDLSVGMSAAFESSFTEQMVENFAAISGDRNPLHLDADYAAAAGFPGPVIFGMMTASLYSQLVGVHLPGKFALLEGIDIHFNAPCFPGDVLTVRGEIVFKSESFKRIEIKARIHRQDGKLASKALIRVGLHV